MLAEYDLRAGGGAPVQSTRAHSGGMLAMAAHPHANLVATSSSDSTVKIWNHQGLQLSTMRQQSAYLVQRGTSTLLAFHPLRCLLASSAYDSTSLNLYAGDGYR